MFGLAVAALLTLLTVIFFLFWLFQLFIDIGVAEEVVICLGGVASVSKASDKEQKESGGKAHPEDGEDHTVEDTNFFRVIDRSTNRIPSESKYLTQQVGPDLTDKVLAWVHADQSCDETRNIVACMRCVLLVLVTEAASTVVQSEVGGQEAKSQGDSDQEKFGYEPN